MKIIQSIISVLGLFLLSPVIFIISLIIKLTSNGPVLYRGERVGKDEKLFTIYKFRTLRVNAEEKIGERLLTDNDTHFTKIGPFLRRTKLDEIPQLINVIKGNMNLVGPRPIRPIFLNKSKKAIKGYDIRFRIKPGITGLAQLRGDYYTDPRNKLRYEKLYKKNRSILFDLKIIFLTFVKIFITLVNKPNIDMPDRQENFSIQTER